MKCLSGYILAKISHQLAEVNAGTLSLQEFAAQAASWAADERSLIDLQDALVNKLTISADIHENGPIKYLSPADLSYLNVLLPWSSYNAVGKSVPLGSAYLSNKRSSPHSIPDGHVTAISKFLDISRCTVLEVGCFEGHYTAALANSCKSVNAIDSRVENVIKTLVRLWALNLGGNVTLDVVDLDGTALADFYRSKGIASGGFDLIHHRGVLYHLADPCRHLADLATLGMAHLYIHTQYANTSQKLSPYQSAFGTFDAFFYREKNIEFAPFAGMRKDAIWLQKKDLLNVLRDLGMGKIEILSDVEERNGSRIELIASR
jgi:2-polyprenyl-3-methyl-5-hydroxy-6-metoxy-1,4-benzoquinol methylase